jgi:hypothetical protein
MALRRALTACCIVALGAAVVQAAPYPTNLCVASKQKEAGKYCKTALKAWAAWETTQDGAARDTAIAAAAAKLDLKWGVAEAKSAKKGVDCVDTTATGPDLRAQVESAVEAFVADVNDGLNLGNASDAACGAALLKAAATKCLKLLKTEAKLVKLPEKDPDRLAYDDARAKTADKFGKLWAKQTCSTTATAASAEAAVDQLVANVVLATAVSPNVDATQFSMEPAGQTEYLGRTFNPVCKNGTPYAFFVKRGTVNKVLYYYQGGGACWEQLTCSANVCDADVTAGDNPGLGTAGFADVTNPLNPFRDWNIVFVSYCSCDIHFGDITQDYPLHVEHRGYQNSRVVEKFAREHFVNPEEVFVTGSSAGAYGAWFNAPLHERVWPAAKFQVLADAGNGVITQSFLDTYFPNWNFEANIPTDIPGVVEALHDGSGIPGYTEAVATAFPATRWAHYTTSFDGGFGGQTGFYNIMLNNNDPIAAFSWWNGSCAFNTQMRTQALATAAALPNNYRYYIGTGSRHTMWGTDRVYSSLAGGVPITIVDWVNGMIDGTPAWTNVECTDCGQVLSDATNDPRPSPLQPPFYQVGPDVVISCSGPPGSPSGAFLD